MPGKKKDYVAHAQWEELPDELAQVGVVRLLLKPQRSHIVVVGGKLSCKSNITVHQLSFNPFLKGTE